MKTRAVIALSSVALLACFQAGSALLPAQQQPTPQGGKLVPGKSATGANGSARSEAAGPAAHPPGSFGNMAQIFQVGEPAIQAEENSRASASPASAAYGRPDLSADPAERKLAAQMQLAIQKGDFAQAQSLASTQALREFYVKHQRAHAEAIQADMLTSAVDSAKPGEREL